MCGINGPNGVHFYRGHFIDTGGPDGVQVYTIQVSAAACFLGQVVASKGSVTYN